jgi:hypothetical protein
VSRETTYADLQKLLMKEMAPILHDDILISAQKIPLFRIRVLDGFEGGAYLDQEVELPLYMECVETAINISQVPYCRYRYLPALIGTYWCLSGLKLRSEKV